jgi:hypothetical protein
VFPRYKSSVFSELLVSRSDLRNGLGHRFGSERVSEYDDGDHDPRDGC